MTIVYSQNVEKNSKCYLFPEYLLFCVLSKYSVAPVMHHYILGEYLPGLSYVIFNNIWQIVLTKIVIDPHYVLEKINTIHVLSNVKFE